MTTDSLFSFRRYRCHQGQCSRRFFTFGGLMRHVLTHSRESGSDV